MATKKRFSATQYSTKWLRKQGYQCETTEQNMRVPDTNGPRGADGRPLQWKTWKRDLFNFCDLLAVKIGETGVTFVQTTTDKNTNARLEKIAQIVTVRVIIAAGNRVHVHGWKQCGGRGKPVSWQLTITEVTFDSDGIMQTEVITNESIKDPGSQESQSEMGFVNEF